MGRKYESYDEAAADYADLQTLANTADSMGDSRAAQGYDDEASRIRQDYFGPDSQFEQ